MGEKRPGGMHGGGGYDYGYDDDRAVVVSWVEVGKSTFRTGGREAWRPCGGRGHGRRRR